MSEAQHQCSDCGTEIASSSRYCVACFRRRHQPCPECMRLMPSGNWAPEYKPGKTVPVDCPRCNNERWIVS